MKKVLFYLCALTLTIGVTSCKKDKGEAAKTGEAEKVAQVASSAKYQVNTDASLVLWEGYKPAGTHNGSIKVAKGALEMKDGLPSAGTIVLDMNSITSLDLETGKGKEDLEAHLKGSASDKADDFFNVAKFPQSTFKITKVVAVPNNPDANCMIYGNLTLKDQTHNIGFKANATVAAGAVTIKTPKFNIDRTKWNIKYGSKTFIDNLGDKFINDEIGLSITLAANKM